ncbi:MAG: hypothetical protein O2807_08015 [bacterium]|nr:hypothetical protein [bacterium]
MAKEKGIRVDGAEVHVNFKRNITPKFHAGYHADPERRKLALAKITTDYYFRGEITEAEKAMLLDELANCPLHNTLAQPPKMEERIHVLGAGEAPPAYD